MPSLVAKVGALTAAGALLATLAIPGYADLGSAAVAQPRSATVEAQSVSMVSTATVAVTSRDGYSVTQPKKAVVTMANFYSAPAIAPPAQGYSGEALIAYAAQFVGKVPYGSGNSPTTSFSCDGYVQYIFSGFGIALPRGADHQARLGVRISKDQAVAGDLVYWPGQHVGIYDGAGGMYNSPVWGRYVEHVSTLWGSPLFIRLNV